MNIYNFINCFLMALLLSGSTNSHINNPPSGLKKSDKIVITNKLPGVSGKLELYMMDSEGNNIIYISRISGSPSWSNSGKVIAAGCEEDLNSICIYDVSTIFDYSVFPTHRAERQMKVLKKIPVSQNCLSIIKENDDPYSDGNIISISWSPKDERLAYICGSAYPKHRRDVCVYSLIDGKTSCWSNEYSDDSTRISWSSKDDILAIGSTPSDDAKVFLMNTEGKLLKVLGNSWSPEWSPDGRFVAYVGNYHKPDKTHRQIGIVIDEVKKGGNDWVFINPAGDLDESIFLDLCSSNYGACRLSWSPDGSSLIFVASTIDAFAYHFFKLDLRTKVITILVDPQLIGNQIKEPDWGLFDPGK